jgi:hypothetical protein
MDNAINYSTALKNKYGDNFFVTHLRTMGAPLNVSNNNQLFGILMELSNYIESRNDNSNAEIISYINNLSSIRNNNDRAEALQFLENLGLNSQQP